MSMSSWRFTEGLGIDHRALSAMTNFNNDGSLRSTDIYARFLFKIIVLDGLKKGGKVG